MNRTRAATALALLAAATALPLVFQLATFGWTRLGIDALLEVSGWRGVAWTAGHLLSTGALALLALAVAGTTRWVVAAAALGQLGMTGVSALSAWWGMTEPTGEPPAWLVTLLQSASPVLPIVGSAIVLVLVVLGWRWRSALGPIALLGAVGATIALRVWTFEPTDPVQWALLWAHPALKALGALLIAWQVAPPPTPPPMRSDERPAWAACVRGVRLQRYALWTRVGLIAALAGLVTAVAFGWRPPPMAGPARVLPLLDVALAAMVVVGLARLRGAPLDSRAREPFTAATLLAGLALGAGVVLTVLLYIQLGGRVPRMSTLRTLQRIALAVQFAGAPTILIALTGFTRLGRHLAAPGIQRLAGRLRWAVAPLLLAPALAIPQVEQWLDFPLWLAAVVGVAAWAIGVGLAYLHLLRQVQRGIESAAV